ncbi:Ger(x)C family spore germination protein [Paenibacillus silviterrae]|uniref:Ger(x)C family spore germination protein n=1 Tax=Paenibacillus silviterrae TaxID=3242194 RepID=UPI0025439F2E|nr:Ger(x)C family spore germination protein [Paenibacillus chinjuensis]
MNNRSAWISAVIAVMLCGGCSYQLVIEKLLTVETIGYDKVDAKLGLDAPNNIVVTVSGPHISEDGEDRREAISTTASSSKEAKLYLSRRSDRIIVSGQLRTILYNEDIAREGIYKISDSMLRDPQIGNRVKLTMVEGSSSKDFLSAQFKHDAKIDSFLHTMMEKEHQFNTIPMTTLHEFTRDYYDDGIDPIMPIIKKTKDFFMVSGIALFQDDRYITRINPPETRVFLSMMDRYRHGDISFNWKEPESSKQERLVLSFIANKRKIEVLAQREEPIQVTVAISLKGYVLEYYGGHDLSKKEEQHAVEAQLEEQFERRAAAIIKQQQTHRVDNLGIGRYVRNSIGLNRWKQMNWREEFPNVKVTVKATVQIVGTGSRNFKPLPSKT